MSQFIAPAPWIVWAAVFAFSACVGSFLNVCIYRLPRDQSIVFPGSRCPSCSHSIAPYDNIPIVSWLLLGAKCRNCRMPIAWRYPVVELLTAGLVSAIFWRFGLTPIAAVYAALAAGLIASSFIDLDFWIIPDEISIYGRWLGLVCSAFIPQLHGTTSVEIALGRSLIGIFVGGGLLFVTGAAGDVMVRGLRLLGVAMRRHPAWRARLSRYRHMKESMGGGDIKLLAMAGAVLGWKPVALAFFLAPLLAVVPGLARMVLKKSHYIPYGPFLSLAVLITMFFGADILHASGVEESVRLLQDYYGWR